MKQRDLRALDQRLEIYLSEMTASLGRSERRVCAGLYLRGLLPEGQRKSIEPLAARVGGNVQALQQFIGQSPWLVQPLHTALNHSMSALLGRARYWVVDETAFPKQGTESVGVARQYCGALGKIASCQVAVSLHWTDQELSWPLGWQLYLPESWASNPTLRAKAGVPDTLVYQTKLQLALNLIDAALRQNLARGVVLADHLYGNSYAWRGQLHQRQLAYALAVSGDTGVWRQAAEPGAPKRGRPLGHRPRAQIKSLQETARQLPSAAWKTVVWREGSRGAQRSRFARVTVWAAHRGEGGSTPRRAEQALIEWPAGEDAPKKYWLCWQPEGEAELLELAQHAKARWKIEQDYRELKEELGLDHFEGRGWLGWHHHVALVTLAFAFLRREQFHSKKNFTTHFA
jgi:SRSO17 transposase